MLEVSHITSGYRGHPIFSDISFSVAKGEIFGVFGQNGAGKSTLLKTIAGFCPLQAGYIMLDHEAVHSLAPYRRARAGLAYVPQENRVFPSLTVRDNLVLPLMVAGTSSEEIDVHVLRCCRKWNWLEGELAKPAGLLSGGQKLIIAMERAMTAAAKSLLVDEPSAGIDPNGRPMIRAILNEFRSRGCAVVLAEQNLDFAAELTKRALVMSSESAVFLPTVSKAAVLDAMRQLS